MTEHETRWLAPANDAWRSEWTAALAEQEALGADLEGEARLLDAALPRHARVLDAGCGTGRLAVALAERGHLVVGVDVDVELLETARRTEGPGRRFVRADLASLSPAEVNRGAASSAAKGPGGTDSGAVDQDSQIEDGAGPPFDAVALVGNVMVFLAPGTEAEVLRRLRSLLHPGGRLVAGFATDRDYSPDRFAADLAASGFELEHRFSTWQLDPYLAPGPTGPGSPFLVAIARTAGSSTL